VSTPTIPGQYFVYIKTRWKHSINTFSFSIYSKEKIHINQVMKNAFPLNFINRLFFRKATKNKNKVKNLGHNIYILKENINGNNGYGYVYVENKNNDKIVYFNLSFLQEKNIKTIWPFNSNCPSLILRPLHKDVIVYESIGESYSSQIQYGFIIRSIDSEMEKISMKNGQLMG